MGAGAGVADGWGRVGNGWAGRGGWGECDSCGPVGGRWPVNDERISANVAPWPGPVGPGWMLGAGAGNLGSGLAGGMAGKFDQDVRS